MVSALIIRGTFWAQRGHLRGHLILPPGFFCTIGPFMIRGPHNGACRDFWASYGPHQGYGEEALSPGWAGLCFPQCFGHMWGFPGGSVVKKKKKKITCQCRRLRFDPWVGKIPWRKEQLPSILARTVPWTEEPGGLQFMRSHSQIQQSTLSLATR